MRSTWAFLIFALFVQVSFADSGLWTRESSRLQQASELRSGQFYRADRDTLLQILSRAGVETRPSQAATLELPSLDGQIERFKVLESSVMAPELAAKFPQIKSYRIRGADNRQLQGRISTGSKGLSVMIVSPEGTMYMDPQGNDRYRAYNKRNQDKPTAFKCGVEGHNHDSPVGFAARHAVQRIPGSYRKYQLAVAATSEYVTAVGGTLNATMEEINATITRVNEIYERDLGITLQLIGDNDQLVFAVAPESDPYDGWNASTRKYDSSLVPDATDLIDQNQSVIDAAVGNSAYDIGHVFGTGGGGIATLRSVCSTSFKAQGATGLVGTPGDSFYIDYVAHEMGHQFGADHTFNGTTSACSGINRVASTAYEPGSGSTIMAYAGICGGENLQRNSDAHFHVGSIAQIDSYSSSASGSCSTTVTASNPNQPTVSADGDSFTIPRETPFVLSASATDGDADDTLSYNWYQMNTGTATSLTTVGRDLGNNPLFRSYLPRDENYRHFPALATTLANKFDDSEVLPCISRTLNFKVAVRDGSSGIAYDDVAVTVDNGSGPFELTSFANAQVVAPGSVEVTWNVANTDQAPVNCTAVDISLLAFNSAKTSYSESLLATGEANDGSATVTIPDVYAARARLKVQCSNQIFYDINDADLGISGAVPASTSGKKVFNNNSNGTLASMPAATCSTNGTGSDGGDDSNGGDSGGFNSFSGGDSGGVSPLLLALLYPLYYLRRRRLR